MYVTYYNLLIAQDLSQAHYQILSITSLELNINLGMTRKNVKYVELNISIAIVFLNIQTLKMV